MKKSIENNKIWDIYTASIQPYLNVYALKEPLVYQYGKLGGEELYTKINYKKRTGTQWIVKSS